MNEQAIGSPRSYDELLTVVQAQMSKLNIGINQLEGICGLAKGLPSKIFSPSRVRPMGLMHLFLIAPELGLKIVFVESQELLEKRRLPDKPYEANHARFGNDASRASTGMVKRVARHLAPIAGRARWQGIPAEDRSKHARWLARRRWRKHRQQQREMTTST